VRVGFDLSRFDVSGRERAERRAAWRRELGIGDGTPVVTLVARLVPIKRVDRFLRVAERLRDLDGVRFLIVGDGELREQLQCSPQAEGLGDRLIWAGFRRDMPDVYFASDVVVQTSDNEGTPVALIEAQAAGVPVVGTAVGGVPSIVVPGETGCLAPAEDEAALAGTIRSLLTEPATAAALAARGRERALASYTLERLVTEIEGLYDEVLATSRPITTPVAA